MYVIVAGAGQVGTEIAKHLLSEGHSVALIESDKNRLEAAESLDVLALEGNAASPAKLLEAGINSADLLVAVTGSDEVNIIACTVAKSKGCKTIARISSADYITEGTVSGKL
jgi:trk system potassium uptake protein TrkA